MKNYKKILFLVLAFLFGVFTTITTTYVFAHGGDINLIHACYKTNTGGGFRIVGANDTCTNNETALDWPKTASTGNGLPFMCSNCDLSPFADKFAGKDFSNAQIVVGSFANADVTGVIFHGALLENVDFSNANVTNADFSSLFSSPDIGPSNPRFPHANLTNANFSNNQIGANFFTSDYTNTNLQNTNFSNTSFNGVNFSGAQNMATANITGVTWNNVTCPDGTNSNSNGNTCVGHF